MHTSHRPYIITLATSKGAYSHGILLEVWQIPHLEALVKIANTALQENSVRGQWKLRHVREGVVPLWSICKTFSDQCASPDEDARLAQMIDITAKSSLSQSAWHWVYVSEGEVQSDIELHSHCILTSAEHGVHIRAFFMGLINRLQSSDRGLGLTHAELIDERDLTFTPLLDALETIREHLKECGIDSDSIQFDLFATSVQDFLSSHATRAAPAVREAFHI